MKVGPDIAVVGALLGDPARANMMTALAGGVALTAGELAREAGVTAQTASSHLARLTAGGLVTVRKQGRHSYFSLSGDDVARVLEGLMGLAQRTGHRRTRPGPAEPALREARVCYDHLAGDLGVALLEGLIARGRIAREGDGIALTPEGAGFLSGFGIDLTALSRSRRPLCRSCLDWSVRRSHLAGALGAAILSQLFALGWARRVPESRLVEFSASGRAQFHQTFALSPPTQE
ncbi:DNA-binding transcriptional ArsR family regulator [Stella humosa]|uniref:DNA-binding transcriptional ArsR family regulator n=1 Tax=Stella humosa TaxID=94 RepID=A0A3N1L034_9PROT|nr:helix-turn-helix transcriptional regulator [Stella humosa]ROP84290.1 DNA-binding transcriptional ArsR family regulator [Stella humosa]BBK33803.1 transcriptional regulator [Stella humosa]